jgi:hypothetical protein
MSQQSCHAERDRTDTGAAHGLHDHEAAHFGSAQPVALLPHHDTLALDGSEVSQHLLHSLLLG